jgi:[ribosomal protein S5]-alanine N-acetyltransferase
MGQYYRIQRKNAPRAMIACERSVLRPWRRRDEAALVLLADNSNVSRYLRDRFPSPYRMSDALAWIALNESGASRLQYAIEVDGKLAGGIGIEPRDAEERLSAEIGYWLGEPFWGRVHARRCLAQRLFQERRGV